MLGTLNTRSLILAGWLAPPLIWLGQLTVVYALAPAACVEEDRTALLVVIGASAVPVLAAGWTAWRTWLRSTPEGSPDVPVFVRERRRFAAAIGALLALQVLLVLAAQTLAVAIVGPCD